MSDDTKFLDTIFNDDSECRGRDCFHEIAPKHYIVDTNDIAAILSHYIPKEQVEKIIGENINWNWDERMQFSTRETDALDYMFAVNSTKDEQRQRLKDYIREKSNE